MAVTRIDTYGELLLLTLEQDTLTRGEQDRILAMGGEDEQEEIGDLLSEAEAVARPKMLWRVAPIQEKGENSVRICGVEVVSPLMRKNFDPVGRVFPYVCTCGAELETWAEAYRDDPLAEFWCEEIRKLYLAHAIQAGRDHIIKTYGFTGYFAAMNPGSIREWPLTGQLQLFAMLGREAVLEHAGVRLTDSLLMLPSKSTSGVAFESGKKYENCSRCPILKCPNRRAKPDPDIVTR